MELLDIVPDFNLYEEFWKIYTNSESIRPQYFGSEASVDKSIIGEGTEIYGTVENSVIGTGVVIEAGALVRNSIVMQDSVIGSGSVLDRAIIAESVRVGRNCLIGTGDYAENIYNKKVYASDIATVGDNSIIPDGVKVGRNTAISGQTQLSDYPDGILPSGHVIIKAGDM